MQILALMQIGCTGIFGPSDEVNAGRWIVGQDRGFSPQCRAGAAGPKPSSEKQSRVRGPAPGTITLDVYAASHRAVREMKADGQLSADTNVRSSKYLNNLIEEDHRGVTFALVQRSD
jgi:hypothetical protein